MISYNIQTSVPRCPKCNAAMILRVQKGNVYYVCVDCFGIWQVQEEGQSDVEVMVSNYVKRKKNVCEG